MTLNRVNMRLIDGPWLRWVFPWCAGQLEGMYLFLCRWCKFKVGSKTHKNAFYELFEYF